MLGIANKNKTSAGFRTLNDINANVVYTDNYLYFKHYEKGLLEFPVKDVTSIRDLNNGRFFVLDNEVYYYGNKIAEADAQTFESLSPYKDHAKDKNHLYINGKIVSHIEP